MASQWYPPLFLLDCSSAFIDRGIGGNSWLPCTVTALVKTPISQCSFGLSRLLHDPWQHRVDGSCCHLAQAYTTWKLFLQAISHWHSAYCIWSSHTDLKWCLQGLRQQQINSVIIHYQTKGHIIQNTTFIQEKSLLDPQLLHSIIKFKRVMGTQLVLGQGKKQEEKWLQNLFIT